MKRLTAALLSALLVAFPALSPVRAADAGPKIAIIDMQKAFNEYYKTKDAEAILRDRMAGFQKERDEMTADGQKIADEAKKLQDAANDKTLSEAARAERKTAFDAKYQEFTAKRNQIQDFNNTRSKQFEDQSRRMRTSIVEEINKFVSDLGTKEKYNLILDKSGASMNGTSVVLFSSDIRDITDDVIKAINANKPASSAAAVPAAPTMPTAKP
jgi:outer membrane protein